MAGRGRMISRELEDTILAHRANGLSYDAIAIVTGVGAGSAHRIVTNAAARAERRAQIERATCPHCGHRRRLPKPPAA